MVSVPHVLNLLETLSKIASVLHVLELLVSTLDEVVSEPYALATRCMTRATL